MRQITSQHGIVERRECRYDSGLTEIGFYTPGFLDGAGPILRGIVWHHVGQWRSLSSSGSPDWRGVPHRSKAAAIAQAQAAAERDHHSAAAAINGARYREPEERCITTEPVALPYAEPAAL